MNSAYLTTPLSQTRPALARGFHAHSQTMTDQQNQTLPPEPPWPQETGVWASYALHCHCGAIRYNMKLSPPIFESEAEGKGVYPVMSCNCSYCERVGYLTVHPLVENVEFTQGTTQCKLIGIYCKCVALMECRPRTSRRIPNKRPNCTVVVL